MNLGVATMRDSIRTNMSSVLFFKNYLDKYEESVSEPVRNPSDYVTPSQYLQIALDRLISANSADSYQMMRELSDRITEKRQGAYSDYNLMMIASCSPSELFKGEIMSLPMVLITYMNNETPDLGDVWFNRVNNNDAIKSFMVNYPTSDQYLLKDCYKGNIIDCKTDIEDITSNEEQITIKLGKTTKRVTLTNGIPQYILLDVDDDLSYSQTRMTSKADIIKTSLIVKPSSSRFVLSRKHKLTKTVIEIINSLGCWYVPYVVGNDLFVQLPGPFHHCVLDIVSFDSGQNWTVGNIQVIPPSLK